MRSDSLYQNTDPTLWISNLPKSSDVEITLFCIPYAGGDIAIYNNWQEYLPSSIGVVPIRLPGRGARLLESARTNISVLALEIARAIQEVAPTKHIAFFGHSMGALLAFEVARYLQSSAFMPVHLFVSGCSAPHIRQPQRLTSHLSDQEFLTELRKLNGTPAEFFDNPDLISLLLPTLRADFEACESYSYHLDNLLPTDVTVFGGDRDSNVSIEHLNAWRELTSSCVRVVTFSGDHFFLHHSKSDMLRIISVELKASVTSRG